MWIERGEVQLELEIGPLRIAGCEALLLLCGFGGGGGIGGRFWSEFGRHCYIFLACHILFLLLKFNGVIVYMVDGVVKNR